MSITLSTYSLILASLTSSTRPSTGAMLSTKVSRSAHRVWTSPVTVSTSYLTSAGTARSSHQRRRSSSKASCPPDSNDNSEPAEKAVATTTDAAATIRNKRLGKHRRTSVDKLVRTKDTHSTYKALPSVPDIQHLHQKGMPTPTSIRVLLTTPQTMPLALSSPCIGRFPLHIPSHKQSTQ